MSKTWVANASPLILLGKGPGESQVIAHSLRIEEARAVLDDLEARRCARTFELPVIGTLGIVLRAKRLGRIERAKPILDELLKVGLYADPELVRQALSRVGE